MEAVAIIARIRAGNPDAFAQVIDQYQVPITRYLYRVTGDYETAKDLTQETFTKTYRSILKTDCELKANRLWFPVIKSLVYLTLCYKWSNIRLT